MRECFLCGVMGGFFARVDSYDYLQCPRCGLVYVDKIESSIKLYTSYDGGFWKSLRRKMFMPFRSFSGAHRFEASMQRARLIFDRLLSLDVGNNLHPVLLDIGCNKGFLLAAALEHAWNVFGVELVPELTLPFKKRYPEYAGNIFSESFIDSQEKMKDQMFDAITAIDVIEHFQDPIKEMDSIYRLLKPGGVLLIQTPDTEHPLTVQSTKVWGALKPREHLHLFNPKNLRVLTDQLGFKSLEVFEPFDSEDGNFVAALRK